MKRTFLCLMLLLCLFCTGCMAPNELLSAAIVHYLDSQPPEPTIDPALLPPDASTAFAQCQEKLIPLAEYLWCNPECFHMFLAEGESILTLMKGDEDGYPFRKALPENIQADLHTLLEENHIRFFGYERNIYGRAAAVWFSLPCQDGHADFYYIRPDADLDADAQARQVASTVQRAANRHCRMEPLDIPYWYLQLPLSNDEGGLLP